MIAFFVRAGKLDEAVAHGRRLRERGQLTPDLVQQLGEVLVRAHGEGKDRQVALRLFSEIVEFDPYSQVSRRLLGDIFLRHGWYDEAYRQFEDLVELVPEDATASIRLARAAAGAGRVDEGLRLLRQVAAGEGRPGANDPRRWARLLAAAYLAGLLESKEAPSASVTRELKRLQLFEGPTTWTLVVWEDLEAQLVLAEDRPAKSGKGKDGSEGAGPDASLGDSVDGTPTGLFAVQVPPGGLPPVQVRHRGLRLDRDVAYEVVTIRFDGSDFSVARERGSVPANEVTDPRLAALEDQDTPTDG